jgi:hypothetical protein
MLVFVFVIKKLHGAQKEHLRTCTEHDTNEKQCHVVADVAILLSVVM